MPNSFSFQFLSDDVVSMVTNDMDSSKAYQKNNILPSLLKVNVDVITSILRDDINVNIEKGNFPVNLKNADITPIFKQFERVLKTNYRAVSILPTLSKIYEKIFYKQIHGYFDKIFSKYLCGFRKGNSTQHCLLFMLEKLKKALDDGQFTGILLTDLTKTFDCIYHDLLIAKLNAYGFSYMPLCLIFDYLSGRKQRTKVNESFSTFLEILFGVPQGSILGPLLFNIQMVNFADDCSPYEFNQSINQVIQNLETLTAYLIEWYKFNYRKPNPDKWHLILSDPNPAHLVQVVDQNILNSEHEKILGVYFDNKLNFEYHLGTLCKKAGQKLHALARVSFS